ncbi:nucleolin-like [Coffea eugenioides]|uniref:nucleolin-like n=1 Tax=Coffea eugenioides TaxID=49369 RepID=UPI000F5C95E2|nr:nucleolin-like [Coffea arabica]XP_027184023.1 nucleolin-like [Coffea eugenioides]
MEKHQSEGHPRSGNEEELEQPTNVDVTTTKSPKKGKRIAKRKSIAQPKGRQTADPSGNQQDAVLRNSRLMNHLPGSHQGQGLVSREPRTEPTTEAIPEYRASSSQPQDKGKAPATEEETEKDDEDEDEDTEEEDPAQFRLARRKPGSSKITI